MGLKSRKNGKENNTYHLWIRIRGAKNVAKEITVIQKKVITEEEKKHQLTDELLIQLEENREAVEETIQLLASLRQAGILDADN